MDINQIKQQFRGRKFGELILHHRRRSNSQITIKALYGYIRELPKGSLELTESQQPVYLESWIDEMNQNVHLE